MSHQTIDHNPELKRLRDEGFNISIVGGFLVVDDVPYVAPDNTVKTGKLISDLPLSGNLISKMGTHVAHFCGEYPCNHKGQPLLYLRHQSQETVHCPGLSSQHSFSSKPNGGVGYSDYYHKMTSYVDKLSGPARQLDPSCDARTFPPFQGNEQHSVFCYIDTASSRAGIGALSERLAVPRVAIVGLGGTGSYVLDLLAKTPIGEIHLFDSDILANHNAFRAPGAASFDELVLRQTKVHYFQAMYSKMRRHLYAHAEKLSEANVHKLQSMTFVFLCLDHGPTKRMLIENLEKFGISFIDVGMGLNLSSSGQLIGSLQVTTSTPEMRDHITAKKRISFGEPEGEAIYATNIQVAELNSLNAAMAVIKWKKLMGFYADEDGEHFSVYSVHANHLINADTP
ncbi:ThiF family adenylyltransferase [Prosthecobacter sp.]|uniref:ThiF family adenylyltransferase n=1 Tax=Prosthecobacter sp. TaxID=1965333 RepID=UPI003784945A